MAAYTRATNLSDFDTFSTTFVEDVLVNDQLTDYRGTEAFSASGTRDIICERLPPRVAKLVRHCGHSIVSAPADGYLDKLGLPDSLLLVSHSFCFGDRIAQLVALRDHSGI
jgi:hypothetical protein